MHNVLLQIQRRRLMLPTPLLVLVVIVILVITARLPIVPRKTANLTTKIILTDLRLRVLRSISRRNIKLFQMILISILGVIITTAFCQNTACSQSLNGKFCHIFPFRVGPPVLRNLHGLIIRIAGSRLSA